MHSFYSITDYVPSAVLTSPWVFYNCQCVLLNPFNFLTHPLSSLRLETINLYITFCTLYPGDDFLQVKLPGQRVCALLILIFSVKLAPLEMCSLKPQSASGAQQGWFPHTLATPSAVTRFDLVQLDRWKMLPYYSFYLYFSDYKWNTAS